MKGIGCGCADLAPLCPDWVERKGAFKSLSVKWTQFGSLCIAIEDDGPGVAEKIKEEILLPTYNRRFGHGLFLVREILDLTRISIQETGTFGVGARFELEVPDGRWRHLPATHIV